jgi:hypothetical protein
VKAEAILIGLAPPQRPCPQMVGKKAGSQRTGAVRAHVDERVAVTATCERPRVGEAPACSALSSVPRWKSHRSREQPAERRSRRGQVATPEQPCVWSPR